MINQEDLVLKDIELCKKVCPIMEPFGIEPDGMWCEELLGYAWELFPVDEDPGARNCIVYTYRQDKLALALPDWCFSCIEGNGGDYFISTLPEIEDFDIKCDIESLIWVVLLKRGQPQLKATAEQLILLEENNLLEEK